jgi:hypothetical protein
MGGYGADRASASEPAGVRGASEKQEVVVARDDEDGHLDQGGVAGFLLAGEGFTLGLELDCAPLHDRHQFPSCGTRLGATPRVDIQGRRSSETSV